VAALLAIAALALGLAGCAQSSNTTSGSATHGAGAAPPSATTPSITATTTTGSGTATSPGSATGLSVSPQVGSPSSVIHFAVTPPSTASATSGGEISDALSVMGPQKSGCVGIHQQSMSALPPGQQTTVSVGPAQLGGNWCPGTYTARVVILQRPKCGQGQMCPQFIRVVGSLGPVGFRIAG
jgi:hypothetical protein